MKSGLIAEIGNMHLGNMSAATKLIKTAKECGADYVKMQAIEPGEVIRYGYGSMDWKFYAQCSFTITQYRELAIYGVSIDMPVFFSIFGEAYIPLSYNSLYKISGAQFNLYSNNYLNKINNSSTIISIPHVADSVLDAKESSINNMTILFVSDHLEKRPPLENIQRYSQRFNRLAGYSDHSDGIDNCKKAFDRYGCVIIEKHFYLGDNIEYENSLYRDCAHSANPEQFSKLALYLKDNWR
jgi:sialic acid synthase SpsE